MRSLILLSWAALHDPFALLATLSIVAAIVAFCYLLDRRK